MGRKTTPGAIPRYAKAKDDPRQLWSVRNGSDHLTLGLDDEIGVV
jgi:hypothetical protein